VGYTISDWFAHGTNDPTITISTIGSLETGYLGSYLSGSKHEKPGLVRQNPDFSLEIAEGQPAQDQGITITIANQMTKPEDLSPNLIGIWHV
jgi:hypothetical protein